jgi:hypothetical protein
VVTALALGDMILYNRRKRNEWYAARREEKAQNLAAAYSAFESGAASEEQKTLISEDKAEKEAKAAKKGILKKAKESLFGGYSLEEKAGGKLGIVGAEIPADTGFTKEESAGEGLEVVKAVEEMVADNKAQEGVIQASHTATGGPLDELASNAAQDAVKSSRSWWGWATGR